MIKLVFQIIFSFLTIPMDICYFVLLIILWLCFSCKEKDEKFEDLPDLKNISLTNLLWKL